VQGDTTTVAAASLAAFYAGVKVGHVEAGLRTGDKWRPFPEEINRRVAGVIADLHFAPTERARQNLLREGVPNERILVTGNPVIDALHWVADQPCPPEVECFLSAGGKIRNPHSEIRNILVTAHRRENFGAPLENICLALRGIAARYNGRLRIPSLTDRAEYLHCWLGGMASVMESTWRLTLQRYHITAIIVGSSTINSIAAVSASISAESKRAGSMHIAQLMSVAKAWRYCPVSVIYER
jgi:hypothetical protein